MEGWHHGLNKRAGANHVSFWSFINIIRVEQGITEVKLAQIEAGAKPPRKKKKYVDTDKSFKNIVWSYNNSKVIKYLKDIAMHLQL